MKIGYLTRFSTEEIERAGRLGFDALEVHSTSWSDQVYGGKTQRQEILDSIKAAADEGIAITAFAHYGPGLSNKGAALINSYKRVIDLASAAKIKTVTAIAARPDRHKTVADNINAWAKDYKEIAKLASDKGVRIGFENWPAMGDYPISGGTMACTPEAWDLMFDAVPSKALGVEYDPSHLIWQGIDYIETLKKYADRLVHVHAKDTEIYYDKRDSVGIYGDGWWAYTIPGLGEIDWRLFINELHNLGYAGGVAIEHEDARFPISGTKRDMTRFEQGLRIGLANLRPLIG